MERLFITNLLFHHHHQSTKMNREQILIEALEKIATAGKCVNVTEIATEAHHKHK